MNFKDFRKISPAELGFDRARCAVEYSSSVRLRWPIEKPSLRERGLYSPAAKSAVERVLTAFSATTKPAPFNDWGYRCLDVVYIAPRLPNLPMGCAATVRLGRHVRTAEPLLVTGFIAGVVGPLTAQIFIQISATLRDSDLVSLESRLLQVDELNWPVL